MAVYFWGFATLGSLVLLGVCAASWYVALRDQRDGVQNSRYWRPAPKNQDLM